MMDSTPESRADHQPSSQPVDRFAAMRREMVDAQLRRDGIRNTRVLDAMGDTPRHEFVPHDSRHLSYADGPLAIGHGQTISQPYIVALMTELVEPQPDDRVLDIGTGSGYQAAIISQLVQQVFSIEIVKPLADEAAARLERLGYENVRVRHGDGYHGWAEHAPFDIIMVAAAPAEIPQPLIDQLAAGGRLVIPVGTIASGQQLVLVRKDARGAVSRRRVVPVRFVPLTRSETTDDP